MPETQSQPGDQNQPTHTAAKVVIPFDIDISQIETKLASLEQRIANARNVGGATNQEQSVNRSSDDRVSDMGTEKQLMMTTMLRISDLMRQINDTVTLIYNTQLNNNNG